MPKIPITEAKQETGKTGLVAFAGNISETYTSKLEWPNAYSVYDEMRRRDPTIRTLWNALILFARTVNWYFEPMSDDTDDEKTADFLNDCLGGMSHTIEDAVEDALSCALFGWSWLELVYNRRPDGFIGWRKWATRRQSSFHKWTFDETGGLQEMVQMPAPDYRQIPIPIDKSLHFIFQRDGGNPEGFGLLESVYEIWYYLKNLQIINGIGWQRTFVGLPIFTYQESPQSEDKTLVETIGKALTVDARQYVAKPSTIDFELHTTANTSAATLLDTIKYYRLLILQTMLADFINLGSGAVGSWSLGSDKSQLYLMGVDGVLDRLATVINRYAVPRLIEYNPHLRGFAKLVHSKVEKPAPGQLADWLSQVGDLLSWTGEDENWLRQKMDMPEVSSDVEPQPEPDEDESEELAEFAEPGRSDERAAVEAALQRDLQKFLNEQEKRVLEAIRQDPGLINDAAFWSQEEEGFRQRFLAKITEAVQELTSMIAEDTEAAVGGGIDWGGTNTEAAVWARNYTNELIKGISSTTARSVQEAVATWVETGQELPKLTKALEPIFGKRRAKLIATTEVTRAFEEANDVTRKSIGLPPTKFKGPAHPGCRCATSPRFINGEWVIIWQTARDERVCRAPIKTPWGKVNGCRDLHQMIVGGPKKYIGKRLSEVK